MFSVTDRARMKKSLRGLDTYGISPRILKDHKKTIFTVRKVHEYIGDQGAIRFYPYCKVYDQKNKKIHY
jgi:hypothetical protein